MLQPRQALVAIASFVAGVALATALLRRDARAHRLIEIEAAALLVLGIGLGIVDPRRSDGWRLIDLVVIVVAAAAMGVQSASIRTVGRISITTTYGTGSLVRVGEKLVAPLRTDPTADPSIRVETIVVLLVVLTSYVGGAALSAALGATSWLVLIPAAAMVAAAVAARRLSSSD